jgi:hypothetical protein
MPVDLSPYRVVGGETPMASVKENNTIDAIQAAMNTIPPVQIVGYPNNAAAYLNGAGGWTPPGLTGGPTSILVKTTTTDVVNTMIKTDLLGNAITIPGGAMTATGAIKFWMSGDYLNNSSFSEAITLELKLGTNVLWDSGQSEALLNNASRHAWWFQGTLHAYGSLTNIHGGGFFTIGDRTNAQAGSTGKLADTSIGTQRSIIGAFQAAPVTTNMAVAQPLTFSVTHSATFTTLSMRLDYARFEVS